MKTNVIFSPSTANWRSLIFFCVMVWAVLPNCMVAQTDPEAPGHSTSEDPPGTGTENFSDACPVLSANFDGFPGGIGGQNEIMEYLGLPGFAFDGYWNNSPDIFDCDDDPYIRGCITFNGDFCQGEAFYLPLDNPIPPGCEVMVKFDAAVRVNYQGPVQPIPPVEMEIFAMTAPLCGSPQPPDCGSPAGQNVCGNGNLIYCMNALEIGYAPEICDNFTNYSFNWTNDTGNEINYILFTARLLESLPPSPQIIIIGPWGIDNVDVSSYCTEICCELGQEPQGLALFNREYIRVENDPLMEDGVIIVNRAVNQDPTYTYDWDCTDANIIAQPFPWEIHSFVSCADYLAGNGVGICTDLTVTLPDGCSDTYGSVPVFSPFNFPWIHCL